MLSKFITVVHRQRMDLTFDITQRPYDYIGDVIGMLREDGLNAGSELFGPPESTGPLRRDRPSSDPLPYHRFEFFHDDSRTVIN